MRVDAYVNGEYCAQIVANSIKNCRTSRVFRDPLSRLDLTAATQEPAAATQQQPAALLLLRSSTAAAQQHCCCCAAAPSAGTNKQTS